MSNNHHAVNWLVKYFGLFLLLTISMLGSRAQEVETEALRWRLPTLTDSLAYINALNRIGTLFYEQSTDSTLYYAYKAQGSPKGVY